MIDPNSIGNIGNNTPVNGDVGAANQAKIIIPAQVSNDSIEQLDGGQTNVEDTPDPSQPILRENVSGMTSAEMFAMIFSALDKADKQRKQSALTTGPQFKPSFIFSKEFTLINQNKGQNTDNQQYNVTLNTDSVLVGDSTLTKIPVDAKDRLRHFFFPPVFVEGYQTKVLNPEGRVLLLPTLSLLGTPGKIDSYDISQARADIASAVAYSEYIQGVVNSGDIKDFATTAVPNDESARVQFSAVMEGQVLNESVNQVGIALGMNGLGTQVKLQTGLTRDAISAIGDAGKRDVIINGVDLEGIASQGEMSVDDLRTTLGAGLADFSAGAKVYTREGLTSALQGVFQSRFSSSDIVNSVVQGVVNSGYNSVLPNSVYPITFNAADINTQKTINSTTAAILKNWGDNIQQIAAENRAADIVRSAFHVDLLSRYKNGEQVREAIKAGLQDQFPDMDAGIAGTIANSVDLGLPKTGALYDANNRLVMHPDDFASEFRNQYQSLGIPSDTPFGQAIEHSVGLSNPPDQTSYTGLMNHAYEVADNESRAYLDPGTTAGETTRQQRLYDPGYQLVMQWSPFMDNSKLELNAAKRPMV